MVKNIVNFSRAWMGALAPLVSRPRGRQVAALCVRKGDNGPEVLMVTSLGTGRWIIPKGWPIDGLDFPGTALQEAWEEAGVRKGKIGGPRVGRYNYQKVLGKGYEVPCLVDVYPVSVSRMEKDFPDSDQRTRRWVPKDEAANMVHESELREIIRAI